MPEIVFSFFTGIEKRMPVTFPSSSLISVIEISPSIVDSADWVFYLYSGSGKIKE